MTFDFFLKKKQAGFLVLTITFLVCATVLIIITGVILRSIGQVNESADSEASLKAWSVVNACGEYALNQLASTTGSPGWSYAGGESLAVGSETCYIYPVESSSLDKLVKASSTISGFTKKILIEVATNTPAVEVDSWAEVADF